MYNSFSGFVPGNDSKKRSDVCAQAVGMASGLWGEHLRKRSKLCTVSLDGSICVSEDYDYS